MALLVNPRRVQIDALHYLLDLYATILLLRAKILYREFITGNNSVPAGIWEDYYDHNWTLCSVNGGGFARASHGGVYLTDPTRWGAWAHRGHRLWASMSEEFWVYVYKVQRCPQPCSHDWTSCPYAHKGERARRRDPRRFPYVAVSCPDYRAAAAQQQPGGGTPSCGRGLKCRYAHGVFELWLHPSRFRTRMCEAGPWCPRRICFFAHFAEELRVGSENAAAAAATVVVPRSPPRILQRAVPPPAEPAAASRDLFAELAAHLDRVRFHSDHADNASSSYDAAAVAAATAPTLTSSDGGEDPAGKCSRCAAEEDYHSMVNDYPHVDLIMDLVG